MTQTLFQAVIFQALSDDTRLRALLLMAAEGELCVCELVQGLDISQPKISRHMALLRDAGLVCSRRHAQWVFYFINPELADWQQQIIDAVIGSGQDGPVTQRDRSRLAAMNNRPARCGVEG